MAFAVFAAFTPQPPTPRDPIKNFMCRNRGMGRDLIDD
jgi:hypothetical protein